MSTNCKTFISHLQSLNLVGRKVTANVKTLGEGGESGHHKRPFNLDWAYSMKQDCKDLNIPYFFKQIDKVKEIPTDLQVRMFPTEQVGSAFL